MSAIFQLRQDARRFYRSGKKQEAILAWRHAALEARKLGDEVDWYICIVWAAVAAIEAGDYRQALGLVLEARMEEPPDRPTYESWLLQKLRFSQLMATRPYRKELEDQLGVLLEIAATWNAPKADLQNVAAQIHEARGNWEAMLKKYEAGWMMDERNRGLIKEDHGNGAIRACLALRRVEETRDWIHAIEIVPTSFHAERRVYVARYRFQLHLMTGGDWETTQRLIREWADIGMTVDPYIERDQVVEGLVRAHLLDPHGGDPLRPSHPAHQYLRRRRSSLWDLHTNYERRRLLLDYRLAALRHTAGISAVDDRYYTNPQQLPPSLSLADQDAFACRLHKARAALRWTRALARHLDEMLECDWRQKELDERQERIDEIAGASSVAIDPLKPF